MKNIFSINWVKPVAGALMAIVMTVSSLAIVSSNVFAQAPTPPAPQGTPVTPAVKGARRDAALEKAFAREQDFLAKQQTHLDKIDAAAAKVDALITKAQQKGLDVSALQSALTVFKGQIADAKKTHQTAADILSAHNGFDASGKVTDATAAHQTLVDARQSLRDTHTTIHQSVTDLRTAVKNWRAAHKQPQSTSTTPTTGG